MGIPYPITRLRGHDVVSDQVKREMAPKKREMRRG
jgi:hypothetical protein